MNTHIGFFSEKISCANEGNCANMMYYIGVGGYNGKKSFIDRRNLRKILIDTVGIVNENEYHQFWADVNNGFVRVGKGNIIGADIFMKWQDTNSLSSEVKYVGFMTGWGATGTWNVEKSIP